MKILTFRRMGRVCKACSDFEADLQWRNLPVGGGWSDERRQVNGRLKELNSLDVVYQEPSFRWSHKGRQQDLSIEEAEMF